MLFERKSDRNTQQFVAAHHFLLHRVELLQTECQLLKRHQCCSFCMACTAGAWPASDAQDDANGSAYCLNDR